MPLEVTLIYEDRFCRYCSGAFTPYRIDQVFCTPECREAWWKNHWKNERHKCPQCGTLHTPGEDTILEIEYILQNPNYLKDSVVIALIEKVVLDALQS